MIDCNRKLTVRTPHFKKAGVRALSQYDDCNDHMEKRKSRDGDKYEV